MTKYPDIIRDCERLQSMAGNDLAGHEIRLLHDFIEYLNSLDSKPQEDKPSKPKPIEHLEMNYPFSEMRVMGKKINELVDFVNNLTQEK